jgi:hypothetical protein
VPDELLVSPPEEPDKKKQKPITGKPPKKQKAV